MRRMTSRLAVLGALLTGMVALVGIGRGARTLYEELYCAPGDAENRTAFDGELANPGKVWNSYTPTECKSGTACPDGSTS